MMGSASCSRVGLTHNSLQSLHQYYKSKDPRIMPNGQQSDETVSEAAVDISRSKHSYMDWAKWAARSALYVYVKHR